jgi:hypothetical protein
MNRLHLLHNDINRIDAKMSHWFTNGGLSHFYWRRQTDRITPATLFGLACTWLATKATEWRRLMLPTELLKLTRRVHPPALLEHHVLYRRSSSRKCYRE